VTAVHRLLSDLRVVRHMAFPVHTEEAARRFVASALDQSAPGGLRSLVWAIVDPPGGVEQEAQGG